ncbi:MAG: hypothetical protein U5L11_02760 [Arhodomonas sp.]|nr:hypothetical protein [Arhodomonas sp.]
MITLSDGSETALAHPSQFVGYRGEAPLEGVLLANHGLHVELQIDPDHPIGRDHPAGIKDVVVEAAVSTIQDCEDSVAAVDGEDKANVYRNWLGLMRGTLEHRFDKGGKTVTRRLNPDREYHKVGGGTLSLPGPQPDAGAQRRPPDDHAGGARRRGRRGPRGHARTPCSPR